MADYRFRTYREWCQYVYRSESPDRPLSPEEAWGVARQLTNGVESSSPPEDDMPWGNTSFGVSAGIALVLLSVTGMLGLACWMVVWILSS